RRRERALRVLKPLVAAHRGALHRLMIAHEPRTLPSPPRPHAAATMDKDLEQPGTERVALFIAREPGERAHVCLLHRILRIGEVSQKMTGEPDAARMMTHHQIR